MLARIASKLMILALVGSAWLGSYVSCDGGSAYGTFGFYDTVGGMYDTVGGYVWGEDYYYEDSFWGGGYTYEPYLGEYYNVADGQAVVW